MFLVYTLALNAVSGVIAVESPLLMKVLASLLSFFAQDTCQYQQPVRSIRTQTVGKLCRTKMIAQLDNNRLWLRHYTGGTTA